MFSTIKFLHTLRFSLALWLAVSFAGSATARAADAPKPLKVLLLAGGCFHDYAKQKDILKDGIEERLNAKVTVIYVPMDKINDCKPGFPVHGNPEYADSYDVVVHDECTAAINDPTIIAGMLKPHRDGIPGVNLHCGVHSYRFGDYKVPVEKGAPNSFWYEYLGLQSIRHGKQLPIAITFLDSNSPITKGMANWTTVNEELYNNIKVWDGTKPLARGKQEPGDKPGENDTVVVWTNEYGPKKTRVFTTSLGHNNDTVADARYLDLVARGLLWATGHLNDDGTPAKGYGKK